MCTEVEMTAYPGWSGKPQRGDFTITKSSHDGREEVLKGLGDQADVLQEDKKVKSVVANSHFDAVPDCALSVGIYFANVLCQSPRCKGALFFG